MCEWEDGGFFGCCALSRFHEMMKVQKSVSLAQLTAAEATTTTTTVMAKKRGPENKGGGCYKWRKNGTAKVKSAASRPRRR